MDRIVRLSLVATVAGVLASSGCEPECLLDVDCPAFHVCQGEQCVSVDDLPDSSLPPPDGDADVDGDSDVDSDGDGDIDSDVDSDIDGDSDGDIDGDSDGDIDDDIDADVPDDADVDTGPGPVSVLVIGSQNLIADPLCDLDGDGTMDNTFQSLPPSVPALIEWAIFYQLLLEGGVFVLDTHLIAEPAVPNDPAARVGMLLATPDGSGDLRAYAEHYSGGMPDHIATGTLLTGALDVTYGAPMAFPGRSVAGLQQVNMRGIRIRGTITPGVTELSGGIFCTYVLASELSNVLNPDPGDSDRSLLDVFVGPGHPLGLPIEGPQPDLDLDGDGLESFATGDDGRVTTCIDGNGTLISGPTCARDPRIADGFSFVTRFTATAGELLPPL